MGGLFTYVVVQHFQLEKLKSFFSFFLNKYLEISCFHSFYLRPVSAHTWNNTRNNSNDNKLKFQTHAEQIKSFSFSNRIRSSFLVVFIVAQYWASIGSDRFIIFDSMVSAIGTQNAYINRGYCLHNNCHLFRPETEKETRKWNRHSKTNLLRRARQW